MRRAIAVRCGRIRLTEKLADDIQTYQSLESRPRCSEFSDTAEQH